MSEPRIIVSPEEAQEVLRDIERHRLYALRYDDLAYTVATEPGRLARTLAIDRSVREDEFERRTRAAVVKVLRLAQITTSGNLIRQYADAIENGAPL